MYNLFDSLSTEALKELVKAANREISRRELMALPELIAEERLEVMSARLVSAVRMYRERTGASLSVAVAKCREFRYRFFEDK